MHYYLLNDTRYENHHGCLTVIANLTDAMQARNWEMVGSLPVGAGLTPLQADARLQQADLVVVNGEGTLHHDTASSRQLMANIEYALDQALPVVLINALWQENNTPHWLPVLSKLSAIYCRDRRSQQALLDAGLDVHYAPDLTFFSQYLEQTSADDGYGLTDSVHHTLTAQLLDACNRLPDARFMPLVLNHQPWQQQEPLLRRIKRWLYPRLHRTLKLPVRPYYKALAHGSDSTDAFMGQLRQRRAVLTARYHCLCFCLQQGVPWLGLSSNSWKVEALLEEIGLPADAFLLPELPSPEQLEVRLEQAVALQQQYGPQIEQFNREARKAIEQMFDHICSLTGQS